MRYGLILVALGLMAAETVDPISDRLRFEIAVTQRDYIVAKAQLEEITRRLQAKTAEAQRACESVGQKYSEAAFSCEAK